MRTGRPVAKIELTAEAAGLLEGYKQRRTTAQALALRARIVLACASGRANQAVAAQLGLRRKRSANGEPASSRSGWTVSMTSHVRACRARSTTPRSRR